MRKRQYDHRLPLKVIEEGLEHWDYDVYEAAANACIGRTDVPLMKWLKRDWSFYAAALNACVGKRDFPLEWIERGLNCSRPVVYAAAKRACIGRTDIPRETIEQWKTKDRWTFRAAAMNICIDRSDVPMSWIEQGLNDGCYGVELSAIDACTGRRDIPLEVIERWIKQSGWIFPTAALNACIGRTDVPLEWIEQGFQNEDFMVRTAAMQAYNQRGISIPPSRDFEPPARVYKKCLESVIVVAEIPKDAHVRGYNNESFRASKAVIKDVIGDFLGEKVGISCWDKTTLYYPGDEVSVENFDLDTDLFSSGFHFFCTLEEAKDY